MQPQPTLTEYGVGTAEGPNGEKFLVLTFATFSGQNVYFFDKAAAKMFAVKIEEQAETISDLVLAKSVIPPGAKQPQDRQLSKSEFKRITEQTLDVRSRAL